MEALAGLDNPPMVLSFFFFATNGRCIVEKIDNGRVISIWVDRREAEVLRLLAALRGKSRSELVRGLIFRELDECGDAHHVVRFLRTDAATPGGGA